MIVIKCPCDSILSWFANLIIETIAFIFHSSIVLHDPWAWDILHSRSRGGNISVYGHNSRILVSVGDRVVKGQVIAEVGKSGYATGNHLHLQLYLNGNLSNPRSVLE